MKEVTRILAEIEQGDPLAAAQLLPLVYEELRDLAAQRLARESPGQTLQATALVHEAYVRLVDSDVAKLWNSRGHFFGAAAEAMRRILVERARQKHRHKHGGGWNRIALDEGCSLAEPPPHDDLLALDEAINRLHQLDPKRAELVKLRFFAGLSMAEAAGVLGVSLATAERSWAFARTWLFAELREETQSDSRLKT